MAVDLGDDPASEAESSSHVVVSLASELYWALVAATKMQARERHPELAALYGADPSLRERVASFWGDGNAHYDELAVLAHVGGVLAGDPPLADFLAALDAAAGRVPEELRLGSETPAQRARLRARLERLRHDSALRGRYRALLAEVWSPLDRTWRSDLPTLVAASSRLDELVRSGLRQWTDFLPTDCHLLNFDQLEHASEREIVASTPGVLALSRFAGKLSLVDLTTVLFCSIAVPGLAAADRERAVHLARQVRAVADPTRLALLRLLGTGEHRVGELAARLGVSQPTVSNHLKVLREGGLVRSERRDGRQQLIVDRGAFDSVLAEVSEFVGSPPAS